MAFVRFGGGEDLKKFVTEKKLLFCLILTWFCAVSLLSTSTNTKTIENINLILINLLLKHAKKIAQPINKLNIDPTSLPI